jgi:hypothetical protein
MVTRRFLGQRDGGHPALSALLSPPRGKRGPNRKEPSLGLVEDVQKGQLPGLRSMRDLLAAALDNPDTPAHARAPLARQLQAVLAEIARIDPEPREPHRVDIIAMHRAARRAGTRS